MGIGKGQTSNPISDPDYGKQTSGYPKGYDPIGGDGNNYTPGGAGGVYTKNIYDSQGNLINQKEAPVYDPHQASWAGTPGGGGGGVAGNQVTLQPGAFGTSNIATDQWTLGSSFDDPNAAGIYGVINNGLNNRANMGAPQSDYTQLAGAASLGPLATTRAAQLAPQMMYSGANLNTANDTQYQNAQNQNINTLNAAAQGQGPSVATVQAQQLAKQNIASQLAAEGSQRGSSNAALGQRAATNATANANASAAATGALGRSQEAMNAQNALTGALSGTRGQAQTTATTQANLEQAANLQNQNVAFNASNANAQFQQGAATGNQNAYNTGALNQANLEQATNLQQGSQNQQTNLANLSAASTNDQLDNQMYESMLQAYSGQNQTDISNSAAYQQLLAQEQAQKYAIDQQVAENFTNNMFGLAGAGASALGTGLALAASDRRAKKNINMVSKSNLNEFLALMVG